MEHLPTEFGYELSITRMTGPIEGHNLVVRRASFRAVLSLQRFEQSLARERVREIRMVAAAHHEDACADLMDPSDRALARWTLTGSAVGTTGVAALAVASAGTPMTLTLALLVIPTLMVLRMFLESWVVSDHERRALVPSPIEKARQQDAARAMARDRRRWQAALVQLQAQQDLASRCFPLRPFR